MALLMAYLREREVRERGRNRERGKKKTEEKQRTWRPARLDAAGWLRLGKRSSGSKRMSSSLGRQEAEESEGCLVAEIEEEGIGGWFEWIEGRIWLALC